MFQFLSVNVCICTSISWYFNKIDQIAFSELEKIFSNYFALFLWNDCRCIKKQLCQTAYGLKIPLIYLRVVFYWAEFSRGIIFSFVFWRPLSANWSLNKRKCRSARKIPPSGKWPLDISKLAWSELNRFVFVNIPPYYKVWLWKCIRWKDYWTDLKRATFSFNRK